MANQNLSQFGEKLFVADADHTFIWDTAASISKRVSRNSWLSGTTADFHLGLADAASPVAQTISVQSVVAGTTNTAGANLSINGSQGTGTGAGGALLLRTAPAGSSGTAQNALVTAVAITSVGNVGIGTTAPGAKLDIGNGGDVVTEYTSQYALSYKTGGFRHYVQSIHNNTPTGNGIFFWLNSANTAAGSSAPNTGNILGLALNSGNVGIGTTSPTSKLHVALNPAANYTTEKVQFGNVFFGNAVSNYSALWMGGISPALTLTNSNFVLASDGSGTILNSPAGSGITFQVNGTNRWAINTSGHFLAAADNTYDIGASGANRPRNVYVGTSLFTGVEGINFDINARLRSPATDVITLYNNGLSDFGRLQFGGTTNLFPSIKRSSTTLQARLADDSAFAPIQGKLTTETAFTATTVTPTGFITLYDSTGTAYKVPCVPA